MSLEATHPAYDEYIEDWIKLRDCYGGERRIKSKTTVYLPATAGMMLDFKEEAGCTSVSAFSEYKAYLTRSIYHDFVSDAVEAMIGFMHRKPPKIEVPPAMETLLTQATVNGESLELLLRRINEQQLVTGRIGLMADLPDTPSADPGLVPYIATYFAENIRNWDDSTDTDDTLSNLNLVVLDESGYIRTHDFTWESVTKYRVLVLGAPDVNEPTGSGAVYQVGVFSNNVRAADAGNGAGSAGLDFNQAAMTVPQFRGQVLDQIPFVFINSKDITPTPDDPPLLDLANLSLAIYRSEADYRQALHKQGQDTLVIIGGRGADSDEQTWRIGSGATIEVDSDGDAKFIGVSSEGLPEQRTSLENDKKAAAEKAGVLIDTSQRGVESGEALGIRVAARTATLTQIAKAGAAGLEKILRIIAVWMNQDPELVSVTPNLEFAEGRLSGQDMVQIMTSRTLGFPISKQSIHALAQDRGLTKLSYDEEMDLIGEENANEGNAGGGTGAGGNPNPEE